MIDFSQIKYLDIPDIGEVLKIEDEYGKVLWEAQESFIAYLRPSADISLNHPVHPNTLPSGYLAISETKSDGTSSYIGVWNVPPENENHINCTSTFKMSLEQPLNIFRVISAKFKIVARVDNTNSSGSKSECRCDVICGGERVFIGNMSQYRPSSSSSSDFSDDLTDRNMPNLVNAINNFIANNGIGVFPEIIIEITNKTSGVGSDKDNSVSSYVTQVYIELTCK